MTNKDAIYILSGLKRSLNEYCGLNNNGQKAFDMAISALQAQDTSNTNVGKMDGDELDEAIRHCDEIVRDITWFCNSPSKYIEQRRHESAVKLRQLASWLRELKRLRTEVYFLKAERENTPVDLLGDVPCKTCRWKAETTEKCEECIDGITNNYEVQIECEDCVSRKAAIDALMEIMDRPNHAEFLYTDEICKTLNELPSAQPEQKTGWWLIREGISDAQCSECKMYFRDVYDMDNSDAFCRQCGTKMEGLKVVEDE